MRGDAHMFLAVGNGAESKEDATKGISVAVLSWGWYRVSYDSDNGGLGVVSSISNKGSSDMAGVLASIEEGNKWFCASMDY